MGCVRRPEGQHNKNYWLSHTVPCAEFATKEVCEELAPSYNNDFCMWSAPHARASFPTISGGYDPSSTGLPQCMSACAEIKQRGCPSAEILQCEPRECAQGDGPLAASRRLRPAPRSPRSRSRSALQRCSSTKRTSARRRRSKTANRATVPLPCVPRPDAGVADEPAERFAAADGVPPPDVDWEKVGPLVPSPAPDSGDRRRRRRRRPSPRARSHLPAAAAAAVAAAVVAATVWCLGGRRRRRPHRCRRRSSRRPERTVAAATEAAAALLAASFCRRRRCSAVAVSGARAVAVPAAAAVPAGGLPLGHVPNCGPTPSAPNGRPTSAVPKRGLATASATAGPAVAVRPPLLQRRRDRDPKPSPDASPPVKPSPSNVHATSASTIGSRL